MRSLADGLPPEFASKVHPDWRKNEADYWAVRDSLLPKYHKQWIGFADGAVIAAGTSAVDVLHAAMRAARHPFVICVGYEDQPFRMRRSCFAYDTGYSPEALPLVSAEFRLASTCRGWFLTESSPTRVRTQPRCRCRTVKTLVSTRLWAFRPRWLGSEVALPGLTPFRPGSGLTARSIRAGFKRTLWGRNESWVETC
jgi:hypothetical protein